ncbi:MAG: gamma-glutamyltransferase, partial [Alphaproteobacteria bacterium]|nr:gamma-glutamyltransferase [Alphaproteobacteria bacterium]
MVVAAQHYASEAGLQILQAGGNAVDAAVAVGYALAVVDPCCGNIGGGGFMLIHLADGRDTFLDFRETAPAAASPTMYLDAAGHPIAGASLDGYRAAGVPGTVMGLDRALAEYGRMQRTEAMAPALALARDGFVLQRPDAQLLDAAAERLARDPEAKRLFLHADGSPYAAGERLIQKDLADTLALVAQGGPQAFYRGPIAAAVAAASRQAGGILTEADFASYAVHETAPLACPYRGYRVVSAPPPSSGGTTMCEILDVVEGWDMPALGFGSPESVHVTVEAMRNAYRDRNAFLGDPAFVANPVARLLSPAHTAAIRSRIEPGRATPSLALPAASTASEGAQTTHYSVVDREGNAVAVTYTINGNFGAGVVAPKTGFLLNNEMDDFAIAPDTPNMFGLVQGTANAIAPGKRPLSSMAPSIVERGGKPVFVLGSPGGSRIITSVVETVMDLVDYGMAPAQAVAAPRFHHQFLPDLLLYEAGALSEDVLAALQGMGYRAERRAPWGAVELIAIGPDGVLRGANDPRRPAG